MFPLIYGIIKSYGPIKFQRTKFELYKTKKSKYIVKCVSCIRISKVTIPEISKLDAPTNKVRILPFESSSQGWPNGIECSRGRRKESVLSSGRL